MFINNEYVDFYKRYIQDSYCFELTSDIFYNLNAPLGYILIKPILFNEIDEIDGIKVVYESLPMVHGEVIDNKSILSLEKGNNIIYNNDIINTIYYENKTDGSVYLAIMPHNVILKS